MLEHISLIIPNLDCVKSYLDVMQLEYRVIEPCVLDPLAAEPVLSGYIIIGIRYKDKGIKLAIREDQWR